MSTAYSLSTIVYLVHTKTGKYVGCSVHKPGYYPQFVVTERTIHTDGSISERVIDPRL